MRQAEHDCRARSCGKGQHMPRAEGFKREPFFENHKRYGSGGHPEKKRAYGIYVCTVSRFAGYRFSLVLLVHGRNKAFDSGTQLRVADDKMYRRGFSLGYHCPLPLVDKYL